MSFSINTVTSDGVETQFPVSFTNGIYDRNNVKVYVQDDVDGTGTPLERSFTWINDGIIELDVAAPAGKTVTLKRVMNKNEPDVNYVNGAILDESNLNQSLDQLLAIQHEILDGSGIAAFNQDVDMNGYRLTNVGQGTQDNDVGTVGQIKDFEESASASAAAAASSAASSASSAFLSQGAYNDFAANYAGSGDTLPVTATDGQRFHYTGATFEVGEYLWLDGNIDPVTSTGWREVSGVGPQGLQGPTGAEGIQGPIGVQGDQGIQGQTGIQGETGLQGIQGIQGEDGNTGPQGTQGIQGITGATGDAGTSFTVDEVGLFAGRTAFDAAADGFSYLATDHVNAIGTGSLFVKQSATNADWSTAIPFGVGPEGAQGIQGITGTQGPQGEDGIQGDQGIQGPTGNQGPQGEDGIQGPVGDVGPDGATGPQGAQGPAGDQGATGATGSTGPTGSQGIRGSRSYYTSGQTSWTTTTALTEIGESALENDVSVQYDTATGFSETRSYSGTAPETSAANWDVVDQTVNSTPIIVGGVATSFEITNSDSLLFGESAGETAVGVDVVAVGVRAGNTRLGDRSVAIGLEAAETNTVANTNRVSIGHRAGRTNQAGGAVAIGTSAGATSQGLSTVAIGSEAGSTSQGRDSVAIGNSAGKTSQGTESVAIGNRASETSQGDECVAVGEQSSTADPRSVSIGKLATCGGSNAVSIGAYSDAISGFSVSIGDSAGVNSTGGVFALNQTCLGSNSACTGGYQVQLGDSATTTYAYGSVQNRSDSRDKADVTGTELGLDFINALTPVQFKWDYREDYRTGEGQALSDVTKDGSKKRTRQHQGFIAQEVKQVMDAQGVDFAGYQDHSIAGGADVKSLGYEEFIAPMVKAIQELTARLEALENA